MKFWQFHHSTTLEGHSNRKNAQTDKKMAGIPEGSDPGYTSTHQIWLSHETLGANFENL